MSKGNRSGDNGTDGGALPSLRALAGSLPVVEVEFLAAKWEAQADETDQNAQVFRKQMQAMECQLIQKAKAYRSCAAELRHYAELARKREGENKLLGESHEISGQD